MDRWSQVHDRAVRCKTSRLEQLTGSTPVPACATTNRGPEARSGLAVASQHNHINQHVAHSLKERCAPDVFIPHRLQAQTKPNPLVGAPHTARDGGPLRQIRTVSVVGTRPVRASSSGTLPRFMSSMQMPARAWSRCPPSALYPGEIEWTDCTFLAAPLSKRRSRAALGRRRWTSTTSASKTANREQCTLSTGSLLAPGRNKEAPARLPVPVLLLLHGDCC